MNKKLYMILGIVAIIVGIVLLTVADSAGAVGLVLCKALGMGAVAVGAAALVGLKKK